jgi:hypothetical protein
LTARSGCAHTGDLTLHASPHGTYREGIAPERAGCKAEAEGRAEEGAMNIGRVVVGVLAVAVIAGAFVMMRYANWIVLTALWKIIPQLHREARESARKQRERNRKR